MDNKQGQIFAASCQQNLENIDKVQIRKHSVSPCIQAWLIPLRQSSVSWGKASLGNISHLTWVIISFSIFCWSNSGCHPVIWEFVSLNSCGKFPRSPPSCNPNYYKSLEFNERLSWLLGLAEAWRRRRYIWSFSSGLFFLEICSLPGFVAEVTTSSYTSLSLAGQIISTIQKLLWHWKAISDSISFHRSISAKCW